MERRTGLRRHTRGSAKPPTDRRQHTLSETESSDEDNDGIPASIPPSVSSSKSHLITPTRLRAYRAKRSRSDVARGGIVLYTGSKKLRNGYNMTSVAQEHLPHSTPTSLPSQAATMDVSPRAGSPRSSPEDDVSDGLVSSVNDAFRRRHTRQAPYHAAECGDVEDDIRVENEDSHLPPFPPADPRNSDALDGRDESAKLPRQAASRAAISAGAVLDREFRGQEGAPTLVDIALLSGGGVWDVPESPGQSDAQTKYRDVESHNNQKLPPKKRGRPPKRLKTSNTAQSIPTTIPAAEKRKVGRPRKYYPRLPDETAEEYFTRLARLRGKPVHDVSNLSTQSQRQPSPLLGDASSTEVVTIDGSRKGEQGKDALTLTHMVGASQGQELGIPRRSNRRGRKLDVQSTVKSGKHPSPLSNAVEPSVRDAALDKRNRNFGLDDTSSQDEYIECSSDRGDNSDPDETDGTISERFDGFNTDSETADDVAQSANDTFEQDVDTFNTREIGYTWGANVFEVPLEDNDMAVHLDYQPLRQLCRHLGDKLWAGVEGNWQWRYFDCSHAKTRPARALLSVLMKLERLYQATPKAPNLKAQNRFLREHVNMLRYYFHKIRIVVEYIRTQRLETLDHNNAKHNTDPRRRNGITQDLVLYVVPMLAHVLVSAWGLGGETWLETSFTSTAVELLRRSLGWIMGLRHWLLRGLGGSPLEENLDDQCHQQARDGDEVGREDIGPLLDKVYRVIDTASNQLAKTKSQAEEDLQRYRQQLRREKQRSRPSPSPTPTSAHWSLEEQKLVFTRIQASFPACPDLDSLRWELNKTIAQTAAMTEQILEKMLASVLVGYSEEERAVELRRVMHTSGVAGS